MDTTLKELKDYAETALEIKKAGRSVNEIQAACTAGSLLLLKCREQSRKLALDADHHREQTARQRAALDDASLQLHNLVYEQQYYDKEISSCRAFKSGVPDEKLHCISSQDFLAQPEQAALVGKSPHEVELARLNYELEQRKQLKSRLQQLQQQKQRALGELHAAAGKIDDLRTQMENLQQSSKPLMETSLPDASAIRDNKEAAELLPLPLYILYTQAVAGSAMVGLPLKVEIEGSTAAAATLAAAAPTGPQDNNAAAAGTAAAETAQASKRRRKSGTHDDHTYKVHPLSVTLNIQSSSQGNAQSVMQLTFQYYTQLKVVGVSASTADDDDILTDLFLGDAGDGQLLENIAAACGSGEYQFGMAGRPRPFRWAQDLAGVDIVSSLPSTFTTADKDIKDQLLSKYSSFRSQQRLEAFVDRLTAAKQGRNALKAILQQLLEKKLPPSSRDSNLLTKINSFILQWKLSSDGGNTAKLGQPIITQQPAALLEQDVQMWQQQMQGSIAEEGEVAGAAGDGLEETSRLAHHDTTEEDLLQGLLTDDAAGVTGAAGVEASAVRAVAVGAAAAPYAVGPADDAMMLEDGALLDDYEAEYDLAGFKEPSEQGDASGASDENAADAAAKDAGEVTSSGAVQALQVRYNMYKLVLRSSPKALEVHFTVKVFLNYPLYPPMFSVTKVLDITEGSSDKRTKRLTAVNEVLRLEQQANFVAVQASHTSPEETLAVQVAQLCQVVDLLHSQFTAKDRVDKLKARQQLRGRQRQARLVLCDGV